MDYETTETVFNTKLNLLLENVSFERNKKLLKELWETKTGTRTVAEWCNKVNVPIAWILDGRLLSAIETLKKIQDSVVVSSEALESSVALLKNEDFILLEDKQHLSDCFFSNIGESYREIFLEEREVLIGRLKTDPRISPDVFSWANKIPTIREVLDEYLQKTYEKQALAQIQTMSTDRLRKVVSQLLRTNPELYYFFLD